MDAGWQIYVISVLVVVGTVAAVLVGTYLLRQAQRRSWEDLASQSGLTLDLGKSFLSSPTVTGIHRGHEVLLDTFTRGAGKNRRTYTRIRMTVTNPRDLRLSLYGENIFTQLAQALGSHDIQLDDPEIDRRFRIKGEPEDIVKQLFAYGTFRQQLLELPSLNLSLQGDTLRYERSGVEKNVERLQKLLNLLGELATQVEQLRY
ncbi:MAG: hypothetical protein JW892_07125 [Anaerolineae bacterium]|nr:hypothetical protein [Anaerolineae bacterium]